MRARRSLPGQLICAVLIALGLAQAAPAAAHGERAQEPYLRTRTAHWYDVKWSVDKLAVNETITISGKFRLFGDWPDAVQPPDTVFVSNATPGPVLARVDSSLNGVPARQSFRNLQIGRDYEYKMVLKGRVPGRFHVHPMIAVKGSGPLVGPGKWVEVSGDAADFTFPLDTLSGERIADLETWGVATAVKWHALWLVIAAAWIIWWIRRPLLIPRYIVLKKGREDLLTTNLDLKVGIGLLVVTLLLTLVGYQWAQSRYPRIVPLQSGTMYTPPLPLPPQPVQVRFEDARYDVPGRSMRLTMQVTNNGDRAVRLGEFLTASIRFVNQKLPAAVANVDPGYPQDVVARNGLVVSDDSDIKPGETRRVKIEATDAAWEIERLTSFLTDVDSKIGGLLFFFDSHGNRYMAEVGGPILPVFKSI